VRRQALQAWHEQRTADDGCHLLAQHLRDAAQVEPAEFWLRLRRMTEEGRRSAALQAAELIGAPARKHLEQLWARPTRFLARLSTVERALREPLGALAVMRAAAQDPAGAASELQAPWARHLRAEWAAAAWGAIARYASLDQMPEAAEWGDRALELSGRASAARGLSDETLAWIARAHLRAAGSSAHAWSRVATTIDAMSEAEQADPTWAYWKARALLARARSGSAGEAALAEAQTLLRRVASPLHFYGQLALEQLGTAWVLPPAAAPPDVSERGFASTHAGLQRALRLLAIGLRSEGVREWNFSLIGMDDRQLLAAAELACDRGVWDRCIRASERTMREIELRQRYPLAFFDEVATASGRLALDAAWVLGVIRQESRFVTQARSRVGAAGLMQVMPATARWTAKRIGLDLKGDWRDDHVTNLRLGTSYLRMVLDDFDGSLPMALAAYNAGPNRARRWRETATLEPAIWTETIPIRETRDYVKKVLSNAAVYARLIGGAPPPPMKSLLGPTIGPRAPDAPAPNKELP
jgi:soluble lytic murein transglycosylase